MNNTTKPAALVALEALVASAADKLERALDDVRNDAQLIEEGDHASSNTAAANFAVGALLPLETLAGELTAMLAAARALQSLK